MPNQPANNDHDLLVLAGKGDPAAFAELFHRYARLVYSFLYEHTDSAQLANDLLQEVFTRLWITRESLPAIRNISAYLYTITRNQVMNELKKKIRERQRLQQWTQQQEVADAEADRWWVQQLDLLDQAISQLPEQQQRAWLLSRREGLSYVEIAGSMGLSRETVKKYIGYANAAIIKFVSERAGLALALFLYKIS
ncbi:MAG: sigma-70 family RNA polymerase sigma factor [Candidatus Pseudobacter hemicellulosilyticus]|uniref:Sigma-70 family RNA polymerase sigma factor n=1 Tax=Candidatus Pseudobacter hemicellulosilyticus TaxID=3121375 RepID=A0AAJ5WVR6_9BACT|nr:MAG: sigma-70 family RNA polymerase sigma factor [Pseudobacter sp.]